MYKLLFVDDEERVLEAIRESVSWEAMNTRVVGWCDNAISALQILINEHVDILITDIKMPVMDGLELVKRAKEMYPPIECVILSGYEEFELAKSAIENGVRGYLLKPCRKEELEEKVLQCIKFIEKNSCATTYWFGERQKKVEQAYEDLINLKIENSDKDYELVRKTAQNNRNYGVLREAAIMLITQSNVDLQNTRVLLKELSHFLDSETLIEHIVTILRLVSNDAAIVDPIVGRMVSYTNEHYNLPGLTVQYIAEREVHLTPKYIGKRFLKEMNMKYSDYLLKVRMEKAIEFMQNEELTAEVIADRIGLGNNVLYFYRLFRQYTGKTFKAYKDFMRGGQL